MLPRSEKFLYFRESLYDPEPGKFVQYPDQSEEVKLLATLLIKARSSYWLHYSLLHCSNPEQSVEVKLMATLLMEVWV